MRVIYYSVDMLGAYSHWCTTRAARYFGVDMMGRYVSCNECTWIVPGTELP